MRASPLIAVALLLAGCRGTQMYTSTDLHQVRQAYTTIEPLYVDFKRVYFAHDAAGIVRDYRREQTACRLVDEVDQRDTIDPNADLFLASVGLDNFCNDIESAYTGWARQNHYPYDKSIPPGRPQDVFVDGDKSLEKISGYVEHPSHLS